jgi:PKD repeat protein
MNRYVITWGVLNFLIVLELFSQNCSADFSYSINCQTITFTDLSSPSADIQSWNWTFPGGTPATFNGKTPPPVVYTSVGEISVTLTIKTTNNSCTDSESKQIIIPKIPTASFTSEVTGCPNQTTFTGIVANHTSYRWDFDFAASITNTLSPVVSFPGSGEYEVTLTAINQGCEVAFTRNITIYPDLVPDFEIIKDVSHCSSSPITLNNTTTGGSAGNIFKWDMGDGTIYEGSEPPSHVYEAYGNGTQEYTIRLDVTNPQNGCSEHVTQQVTVLKRPLALLAGGNDSPVNSWEYTIRNCENASVGVDFVVNVFYDPSIASSNDHYLIESNPGNNVIWDATYPPTAGTPATFTYTELGIYDLTFTITGTNGCIDSKTYQVLNIGNPAGGLSNLGTSSGCAPVSFSFPINGIANNHSSTQYFVDFGDGNQETFNHPAPDTIVHVYNSSSCPLGIDGFSVRMTIQNQCDYTLSSTGPIRVWSAPEPDFDMPDMNGCVDIPMVFENRTSAGYGTSCNQNVKMYWDFGDGNTLGPQFSVYPYPDTQHTYTEPGKYTVSLTAGNQCNEGVEETAEFEVCIENNEPADFELNSEPSGCAPYVVNLRNISHENSICKAAGYQWTVITPDEFPCDDDPASDSWEFFAGNENSVTPTFRFLKPGEYTIQMTMNNGCIAGSVHEQVVTVKGSPVLDELTGITGDCAPVTITPSVSYQSCLGNVNPVSSFNWLFPGGTPGSSAQQVPGEIIYTADGLYTVTVTAENECGISNELSATFAASPGIENNTLTAPAETTICQGQIPGIITGSKSPQLSGGDGNYAFEWQMSKTADFTSPTVVGNAVDLEYNQQLLESFFFRRVVRSGGCINISDAVSIIVVPGILNNTISANQSVCQGSTPALLVGAMPTGGSSDGTYAYQWQINTVPETLWEDIAGATGKDYQPTALNISRSYRRMVNSVPADDCESISVPVVITVNSIPMITSSPSKLICSGEHVNYNPTSNIPGTTFQWNVIDNSAGCITGIAANSGVGIIAHNLVNTCGEIKTVSYLITPVGPTGCTGDEFELVMEVNPRILLTLTPANPNPGYGTWTTITANISGGTGSLSITWQGGPITSGQSTPTITTGQLYANTQYEIIVTDENNCSVTASVILVVGGEQPILSVSANPNPVCPGWESTLTATATGGSGNFSYQWFDGENNPIPSNGQNQITVQPPVTTTYTVTADDGFNPVLTQTITLDVNVTPQITSPVQWEICSQTQVAYQHQSNVEGTTFTWFSTNNSPECIDEFGGNGTGNIQTTLVNNCLSPQNIIYTVVPTSPEPPLGGCPGIQSDITVTVNPFPHIVNTPDSQTNISGATPNPSVVVFESNIDQNITYSWSTTGNSNLENSYPLNGTGDLVFNNPFTILPSGNETEILEYTVFPVYNGVMRDCPGQAFIYTVIIKQTPSLYQVQGGGAFCDDGVNCVDITLSGSQDGVSYQLRKGTTNYGPPVPGNINGSPITWSCISEPGNYAVVATNQTSGAINLMEGNALVSARALPETFNIYPLAPGNQCIPVTPWLNGSETNVVYRLNRESQGIFHQNIEELTGDGGPMTFSEYMQPGKYTITAIRIHSEISCPLVMSGVIDAIPLPLEYPVTPVGVVCEDVEEICITQSETGIEYQLWLNNQPVSGTSRTGNGGKICFGVMSAPGTYRIRAKNPVTSCELFFKQTVTVNPAPIKYSLAPEFGCAGTEITLIGCDKDIEYYLFVEPASQNKSFSQVMGPVSCNSNGLVSFGAQLDAGIYTVKAVNPVTNCATWMDGTTTIFQSPLVFEISPQGSNCPPVAIKLDNSETDVTYFLYRENAVVSSLPGTGGSLNFGTQTLAGVYTVKGRFLHNNNHECWSEMTGSMIIQPSPAIYTLMPTEPVCSPAAFYLNESQSGVTYSLYHNLSGLKQTLPGTGGPLTFAQETESGEYWVQATSQGSGNCSTIMSGTRTILPQPNLYSILPGDGRWCLDNTFDLGLTGSDPGFTYELHKITTAGNPKATFEGNGNAFAFSGFEKTAGTWRIKAINNTTGCERWMSGQAVINNAPVSYHITANGNLPTTSWYCPGTVIGLEFSQTGVNYLLKLPTDETIMVAGTGSSISFGAFNHPGNYTITAINPTTTCDTPMQGTITINSSPEIFDLAAVNNIILYCEGDETAIDLVLVYSATGVNYQLFNGTTNMPVLDPQAGTGEPLVWNGISQFGSGEYFVVATFSDDSGCEAIMNGMVNIGQVDTPSAFFSGSQTICYGHTADVPVQLSGNNDIPLMLHYKANGHLQEPFIFYPGQNWGILAVSPTENTVYELVSVEYFEFGNCDGVAVTGTYQVVVEPLPVVDAGDDTEICVSATYTPNPLLQLAKSPAWRIVSGQGTLINSGTINPTYIPDASDAGTTVKLEIEASGLSTCSNEKVQDTLNIFIKPLPLIVTGEPGLICETGEFITSVSVDFGSAYFWEIVSGSGTLNTTHQQNTIYKASPQDAGKTVILKLTVTGEDVCNQEHMEALVEIMVNPLPQAFAGNAAMVCENGSFQLNGTATHFNTASVQWTVSPVGAGVFDDPGNLQAVFNPSAVDSITAVELHLTVSGDIPCQLHEATSTMQLEIHPLPLADAGGTGSTCVNSTCMKFSRLWLNTMHRLHGR